MCQQCPVFFDWSVTVQPPDAMMEKYPVSIVFSSFAVNIFDLLPAIFVIVYITLSGRNSNLNLCHKLHKSFPAGLCTKTLYIKTTNRRSCGRLFHFQKARDFVMKEFWSMIQLIFTALGGWLGYFLGAVTVCFMPHCLRGDRLHHGCDVRHHQPGVIQRSRLQRDLPQSADLPACRDCKHHRCAGNRNRGGIADSVIFFYISNEGVSCWRMQDIWGCRSRKRSERY